MGCLIKRKKNRKGKTGRQRERRRDPEGKRERKREMKEKSEGKRRDSEGVY